MSRGGYRNHPLAGWGARVAMPWPPASAFMLTRGDTLFAMRRALLVAVWLVSAGCADGDKDSLAGEQIEIIPLTVVSGYAPTAAWVEVFREYYIPEVDRRLAEDGRYRIRWNEAWGTIAKPGGELDVIDVGLADMGIVQTVFHPDRLPMYNLSYVTPFVTGDIDLITRTLNQMADEFPDMKGIWERYHQVMLTTLAAVDNYQLVLASPIREPVDLAGRKIGGAGLNLRYIEGTGAVGVTTTLADFYNNLNTGIVDGIIVWPEAADNYKLYEVAPYFVKVDFGGVSSMALTVNARSWRRLPEHARAVLMETAQRYRRKLAATVVQDADAAIDHYLASGGTLIELSREQRVAWAQSLPGIAGEWALRLEGQGYPGRYYLDRYLTLLQEQGPSMLRDWRP